MSLRVPLPLLVVFLVGLFIGSQRAQDSIQGPYTAASAAAPLASSVRVQGPFTANTPPGWEVQFGYDPGDANHCYVFHNHAWHRFRLDNLP